jgi:organic radical activating enzyme
MLAVSEVFESIQGEGPSAGEPALFLRLGRCNLHCRYCDTRYTWDFEAYRFEVEIHEESVEDVAARLSVSALRRLVVTGGEPLLQQPALARLLSVLPGDLFVEVETNGTMTPDVVLRDRVNQWNVSPKLSNGGDPESLRIRPGVLAAFLATERAYLKLVVGTESDAVEAEALIVGSGWPRRRVLLMAEASTRAELSARAGFVAAEALRRGVRYSPRLHVELWGGERGR